MHLTHALILIVGLLTLSHMDRHLELADLPRLIEPLLFVPLQLSLSYLNLTFLVQSFWA